MATIMSDNDQVASYNKCWCLTFEQKKEIYGKMRLPVGGKDEDDDGKDEDEEDDEVAEIPPVVVSAMVATERGNSNVEPVSYNSMSIAFWADMVKGFKWERIYDLTPLDGNLAMASTIEQREYVGICFTNCHAEMLNEHLVKQILTQMQTPGSKLFDINYVAHLKKQGPSKQSTVVTPGDLLCTPDGK